MIYKKVLLFDRTKANRRYSTRYCKQLDLRAAYKRMQAGIDAPF